MMVDLIELFVDCFLTAINQIYLISVIKKVQRAHEEVSLHLQDHRRGEILRDGCRIAILGAPNAGKVRHLII